MDREQMKMAILNQEQIFRQQVHELHRLYHVQTQLMRQMPATAPRRAPAIADTKPIPQLDVLLLGSERAMATNVHAQLISFSSCAPPASAAAAPADGCNLELTLATGSATTTSSSSSGWDAGRQTAKRAKLSPTNNSDSGTTAAVSSTSTESELALFGEADATTAAAATAPVRFQVEGKRIGEMGHGAWMPQQQLQCLSLRMA